MKTAPVWISLVAAVVLGGCSPSSYSTGSSNPPSKDPVKPQVADQTPPVVADNPAIAADLKHDGYHWYGLTNDKPLKMEVDLSDGRTYTGTQTFKFKSTADGKALFDVLRTDGLKTVFGNETASLEKDGVYTTSSTKLKGATRSKELPANVSAGATWSDSGKVETTDNKSLQPNQTYKVVGEEMVTTKAGTTKALRIASTGDSMLVNKKYRMETSYWYVKDKGLVKAEIRLTSMSDKKAKQQVITIQETN